jgi:hypothetical protein
MPEPENDKTGAAELRRMLDEIFGASNWKARVEEEMRNVLKVRRKNQQLSDRIKELEGAAPKDGAVVIKKEEMEELTAFRALALKPADITTLKTEHTALKAKQEERDAEELFAEAGEALGYKNIPALTRFLKRENLVIEMKDSRTKDEENPGKWLVSRIPVVKPKGDDKAEPMPLDEYVQTEVPEFESIFQTAPEEEDDEEGAEGTLSGDGSTTGIRAPAGTRQQTRHERAIRTGTGVPIAGTPRVRPNVTPNTRDSKVIEEATETARKSGTYSF